jgi:transcriptional regulator with XRE-family HTH domain
MVDATQIQRSLSERRFGQVVRQLRKRRGMTVINCARTAGMWRREQWIHLETGRCPDPRWTTVQRVAHALQCSTDELRTF